MTTPLPSQFGQSTGQGSSILSQMGIGVSGGSTVSSGFTPQPGSPTSMVYLGANTQRRETKGPFAPSMGPYNPKGQPGTPYLGSDSASYAEAKMLPTTWDNKEMKNFINKGILYKMPGFSADMGLPETMSAWDDLIQQAQAFSTPGHQYSPYDIMETYNKKPGEFGTVKSDDGDWLLDARTGEKIKYIGPRSKTTTEKRVDLSSAEDVRALTTQMLTQLLGRAPTAEEMVKYRKSIGGYEAANPSVATTTTTINDQGVATDSNTTTSGGTTDAARQMLIQDQAKQGPEYGKYQSATTYFNALMQMMGG